MSTRQRRHTCTLLSVFARFELPEIYTSLRIYTHLQWLHSSCTRTLLATIYLNLHLKYGSVYCQEYRNFFRLSRVTFDGNEMSPWNHTSNAIDHQ